MNRMRNNCTENQRFLAKMRRIYLRTAQWVLHWLSQKCIYVGARVCVYNDWGLDQGYLCSTATSIKKHTRQWQRTAIEMKKRSKLCLHLCIFLTERCNKQILCTLYIVTYNIMFSDTVICAICSWLHLLWIQISVHCACSVVSAQGRHINILHRRTTTNGININLLGFCSFLFAWIHSFITFNRALVDSAHTQPKSEKERVNWILLTSASSSRRTHRNE